MGDFEADTRARVTADELFGYISDVANLPVYFSRVTAAEAVSDTVAHVTFSLDNGAEVERDIQLSVDGETRMLSWACAKDDLRGHVTVAGVGDNAGLAATITSAHGDGRLIHDTLLETLANIRKQVEHAHPRPEFDPAWADHHEQT